MDITLELPFPIASFFVRAFSPPIHADQLCSFEREADKVVVQGLPYGAVFDFLEHHGPGGYELRRHHEGTDYFIVHPLFEGRYRDTC